MCVYILFLCFIVVDLRSEQHTSFLVGEMGQPNMAFGRMIAFGVGSCYCVWFYNLPMSCRAIKGVCPTQSGVIILPFLVQESITSFVGTFHVVWWISTRQ